jgi:Coiled-coil domain-containing protein 124 /Oxs1
VDRHPERRVKAAFTAFEARRLDEMKDDKGLRRNQKVELIRREFEKSPENPMNQVSAKYNSSKDEVKQIQNAERKKTERRLVGVDGASLEVQAQQ